MAPLAFEVDTGVLDDVLDAVGAEQVAAFVKSVDDEIGRLLEHLSVRGTPGALDAIAREAHHLSGGCRSLGFVGLGAVCARIEADARRRVDDRWPIYSTELAQQRDALSVWWSGASANHGLTAL